MPTQRGPAADSRFLPTTHPSNPYSFTPTLLYAGRLPPRITGTHVFFFGHEGEWPETCFSQWFAAPFTINQTNKSGSNEGSVEFPTMEHYMMYHKAILMSDYEIAARILDEPHPSMAKKFGREVRNFDRGSWAKSADGIVEQGNWLKFSQNNDLAKVLLATGNRMLVEASPDDRTWGIGFNAEDAESRTADWGDNRVGKALMKVRDRLEKQHGI